MKNKSTLYLVQAAVIAALYVGLTYAQELLIPNSTSMAVQFRISEVLTMLALFTPAAIPGLTAGCVLANIVCLNALPIDMVIGPIASFLAVLCIYKLKDIRFKGLPILASLMPAIFNGVIIGLEIEIFFVPGGFHFADFLLQGALVALGELGVCVILGLPLTVMLEKTRLSSKLFKTS